MERQARASRRALRRKLQELIGGEYGEMTVTMQYLFQGWNCRMPGQVQGHDHGHRRPRRSVTSRCSRPWSPGCSRARRPRPPPKAAAANPALAAVLGGQNPQHAIVSGGGAMPANSQGVPWNGAYIVASGNLLADFRANVAAEAQGRLQTARLYNMTDDPGVKEML